jgi:hypothetical protein
MIQEQWSKLNNESKGSDDHISDIGKMVEMQQTYTLEQMRKAFEYGKTLEPFDCFEDLISSLKKPKKY